MRKIILQMYTSLDGLVAGPNGELDWIFSASETDSQNYADTLLNSSDLILIGRGMAKGFLDYWPTDTTAFAAKINKMPKMVFSKTWKTAEWPDVTISENVKEEINKQKAKPGKNLILYGGAGLVQSFIKLNLIDEYHLMEVPVVLGRGLRLFDGLEETIKLKLIKSKVTTNGVVINHHEPLR